MYIVGFNGPPGSGKDSIAKELMNSSQLIMAMVEIKLATRLRAGAMALAGIDDTDDNYVEWKGKVIPGFGCTLRQLMIYLSEKAIKPAYGLTTWSALHWDSIRSNFLYPVYIAAVTDIGFQFEVDYMIERVPLKQFLLVRLTRKGTSYEGDSRGPVDAPYTVDIENNSTLEVAATKIKASMRGLGWNF